MGREHVTVPSARSAASSCSSGLRAVPPTGELDEHIKQQGSEAFLGFRIFHGRVVERNVRDDAASASPDGGEITRYG